MGIANSSMLVNLSISLWSGRKLDKTVSAEVDVAKSTKTRAGNYHKNLFAGVDELAAVGRIAGKLRVWCAKETLPWSDNGDRLLTMDNFQHFKSEFKPLETEFNAAADTFCDKYSTLISAQAFTMGALFDRNEYPEVGSIRSKFGVRCIYTPVVEVGDWRVDANEKDKRELAEQYEQAYKDRLQGTTRDLWDRLHAALTHMAERLEDAPDGGRKIFRDTLFEVPVELCGLLTRLNVNKDPKLEEARKLLGVHGVQCGCERCQGIRWCPGGSPDERQRDSQKIRLLRGTR
jgi:hypothetical protein